MKKYKAAGTLSLILLLLPGCALFGGGSGAGLHRRCDSPLAPGQCAWTAAAALGDHIGRPGGSRGTAPVLRLGPGSYLIEARSRPGGRLRFRRGGGFRGEGVPPALPAGAELLPPDRLLARMEPLPLVPHRWRPAPGAPFPLFYEERIQVRIDPVPGGGSCLTLAAWGGAQGSLEDRLWRDLTRLLGQAEALARGNARLRRGDLAGALAAYDRGRCGQGPPLTGAHRSLAAKLEVNRGILLARLGRPEPSRAALFHALRLEPGQAAARPLAALAALCSGRKAAARRVLACGPEKGRTPLDPLHLLVRRSLARAPAETEELARGRERLVQGRARAAARSFLRARARHPLAAALGLARSERALGRHRRARDHLLYCLALAPGDPALLAELSRVERERGAPELALHHAALLGPAAPFFRLALRRLDPAEAAARLTLGGRPGPALPAGVGGALGRVLAALRTGRMELLGPPTGTKRGRPATPPD